jgi:hypothetical protein
MKYLVLCAILLSSVSSFASRVYGDEITVDAMSVNKIMRLMKRDVTGSTADQAMTNAVGICQIYIDDMKKQGYTVYSFRPYADSSSSEYVWIANCEATTK